MEDEAVTKRRRLERHRGLAGAPTEDLSSFRMEDLPEEIQTLVMSLLSLKEAARTLQVSQPIVTPSPGASLAAAGAEVILSEVPKHPGPPAWLSQVGNWYSQASAYMNYTKDQVTKLTEERQSLHSETLQLRSTVEANQSLVAEASSLRSSLEAAEKQIAYLTKENETRMEVEVQNAELRQTTENLLKAKEQLEQEKAALIADRDLLAQKISVIKKKPPTSPKTAPASKEAVIDPSKQQCEAATSEKPQPAVVISSASAGWVSEFKDWFTQGASLFLQWEEEVRQLLLENQTLKTQNSELQTTVSKNLVVMGQLQEEKKKLEKEKQEWAAERAALEKARLDLQMECSKLMNSVQTLSKEKTQLEQEKMQLEQDKTALSASTSLLTKKLETVKSQHAEKVYLGGAALLGVLKSHYKNLDTSLIAKGFRCKSVDEAKNLTESMEGPSKSLLQRLGLDKI